MTAIASPETFVRKYSELMLGVWRDDAELTKLLADPTKYATEAGLPVDAGATVTLDRGQKESLFTKDEVIGDWTKTPGQHILHVPETPLVDLSELTDDQLETVAGGLVVIIIIL
ncbi:hypothetical protein [Actinoplanes sp. HUAS TT8]|uniref:hypothetical protein n=1 Tax=Actinoplanes sp. HUAS TT8 TaxID=3447453 RepID=UPI003F51FCD0